MDDSCVSFRVDSSKDLDPLNGVNLVKWHRPKGPNQNKKVPATITV
jgi:hypothetical protein